MAGHGFNTETRSDEALQRVLEKQASVEGAARDAIDACFLPAEQKVALKELLAERGAALRD